MKLIYLLLCMPLFTFSQTINNGIKHNHTTDTTYVSIARDLGYCFNEPKPLHFNSKIDHPDCYKEIRVFYIEPKYYAIYVDAALQCGSCGCHLSIIEKKNDIYEDIGSISCIHVDMSQPISNDFIIIGDGFLTRWCDVRYSGKYSISKDSLKLIEVIRYSHEFHGRESEYETHQNNCTYKNSSWISDRKIEN